MSYNKIRAMNLIAKMGIKPPPGFITAIPPMSDNSSEAAGPEVRIVVERLLLGKKSETVENRMQQCCWGIIIQYCQQYSLVLLHLIAG